MQNLLRERFVSHVRYNKPMMICFVGNTGVGKTTVANYLSTFQGFKLMGLRDPLQMAKSDVLRYSERGFKQLFGERALFDMFKATLKTVDNCDSVVIDDLCTDEDVLYFKMEYRATIIKIVRPNAPCVNNEDVRYADYVLENNGTVDQLLERFDKLYYSFF